MPRGITATVDWTPDRIRIQELEPVGFSLSPGVRDTLWMSHGPTPFQSDSPEWKRTQLIATAVADLVSVPDMDIGTGNSIQGSPLPSKESVRTRNAIRIQ